MQTPNTPPVAGTTSVQNKVVKKKWAEMTKDERAKDKELRIARAIQAVKAKTHSPSFLLKLGDFTMAARPSGMTEKGSMSYSLAGKTVLIDGKQYRLNQFSISQLPEHGVVEGDDTDWDSLAGE